MLLYLNTGAGHVSSAKTIAKYLTENYNVEPVLIDGFAKTNKTVKYIVEDGYRISQAKAQWVFEALYALNKINRQAKATVKTISFFVKDYLREMIQEHQPAKIVIFHFFLTKAVHDIVRELKLEIPIVTVATDPYTAPKIWFTETAANYIVFSERAKRQSAMAMGVPAQNINVFPFIINDKFNQKPLATLPRFIKQKLGFNAHQQLTVIMGGGDGMPRCRQIVKQFVQQNTNTQLAVVCGRNKAQYDELNQLKRRYNASNITIYGFIDFMFDLLSAADFVITKGGPSSVKEILMLNKIPIINSYIWEQEKGNMEFVRDNNLGFYEPDIKKLPQLIERLSNNQQEAERIIQNIANISLQNGTQLVSDFIYRYGTAQRALPKAVRQAS